MPGRRARVLGSLVAAMALTTLAVSACGGSSGTGASTSLQLYNDKAAWTPFYKQMSTVAQKDIGLSITPDGYADEPTYQAFVKSALKTANTPDLFTWATGPQLDQLVQAGEVANTSSMWKQAVSSGELPQSLEQYYTVNGQQYCIPENVSYWVMFYNKHSFASAGINSAPTTWAQLMNDAALLKQKGTTPFYQTNVLFSFVWFQTLLAGENPTLYTQLTEGKASYTDPGVVQVMQQWENLINKGYMSDPGIKTDPATMLKSGQVAMIPDGTWFNTSMVQAGMKSGSDYGMFVIPTINPSLATTPVEVETGPLCTSAKSSDSANVNKFASWWLGTSAQTTWANSRDDVSANPKVDITDPQLKTLTQQVAGPKYQLLERYYDAVQPDVLTAALSAFGAFMSNPSSYMTQLQTIQQANASAGSSGS
jgi:ABC-type glycerol-3-phosphate transport system substrate-binding protein